MENFRSRKYKFSNCFHWKTCRRRRWIKKETKECSLLKEETVICSRAGRWWITWYVSKTQESGGEGRMEDWKKNRELPCGVVSCRRSRTGRCLCNWCRDTRACCACPSRRSSEHRSWATIRSSTNNCVSTRVNKQIEWNSFVRKAKKRKALQIDCNSLDDHLTATVTHKSSIDLNHTILAEKVEKKNYFYNHKTKRKEQKVMNKFTYHSAMDWCCLTALAGTKTGDFLKWILAVDSLVA